jgi:hypothetical protein
MNYNFNNNILIKKDENITTFNKINSVECSECKPSINKLISILLITGNKLKINNKKLRSKEFEKVTSDNENKEMRIAIETATKEMIGLRLTSIENNNFLTQQSTDFNESEMELKKTVKNQAAITHLLEQQVITLSNSLNANQILANTNKLEIAEVTSKNKIKLEELFAKSQSDKEMAETEMESTVLKFTTIIQSLKINKQYKSVVYSLEMQFKEIKNKWVTARVTAANLIHRRKIATLKEEFQSSRNKFIEITNSNISKFSLKMKLLVQQSEETAAMLQTEKSNCQQLIYKAAVENAASISEIQNSSNETQANLIKKLEIEILNVKNLEIELSNTNSILETSQRNELTSSDIFLRVTRSTDIRIINQKRWEQCSYQLSNGQVIVSMLNPNELHYTFPSEKKFTNIDASVIHQFSPNGNKKSLVNHLYNRIDKANAEKLIENHPNVFSISSSIALLEENGTKNTMVSKERFLNDNKELDLRPIYTDDDFNGGFWKQILPILEIRMLQSGLFVSSDALNEGFVKDQGDYITLPDGSKKFKFKRTNIGTRLVRLFIACGNKLSSKGYSVSILLSDSSSSGGNEQFKENVRKFLTNSNCYEMTKVKIDELSNKSLNLMIVFSSKGEQLGQLCIPILRWDQVLLSNESCPFYMITHRNLCVVSHGLKG